MKIDLRLEGGRELAAALKLLERGISYQIQIDALLAGAEPMRAHAAALAPRSRKSTPHTADDILAVAASQAKQERRERADEALVEVGPSKKPHDHFYDYFQEYGTRRHRPRPHMRPAFDATANQSLAIALAHLWAAIARITAKGANR